MDSEDVDVIFENSVLHQVLQETGASNVETEPRSVPRQGRQKSHHWRGNINNVIKQIVALLPLSWRPASLRLFLASMFVPSFSLNSLHLTYQKRTLKRLLASPLLCKDDSTFLDLYLREDEEKKSPVDSNAAVSRRLTVSKGTVWVLGFVMMSLGTLHVILGCQSSPLPSVLSMPVFSSLPFSVGITFDLFTLAFVLFIMGLSFVWSFKKVEEKIWLKIVKDLQQANDRLLSFEKISQELVQSMIKCLRFVKDSELLAKGFLVARPTSNTGGSSFVSEPHHWCPRLRHLLFDGNMQMVKDVKETVSRIHDSISLTPDFEALDDRYFQQQDPSFELLRLCDNDSVSSGGCPPNPFNEDVEFANNVIPSPKLSALLLLFRMHISYFFRGLAICFHKESLEGKRADFYSSVAKSVIPLRDSMSTLVAATKENHDFYRASAKAGEDNPNQHAFSHEPKGPTEDLYRCVNSLDIRLQSVADKAMKLRLELEKKVIEDEEARNHNVSSEGGEDDVGIMNSSDKTYYEDALRCIKIDLDLCVGCYDESLRKLHVRERQEIQPSQPTAEASTTRAAAASMNSSSSPKVIPLKDPVIVDEVFEATIEEEDVEAQERPSRYRRFTREEREQMRQHRDDLKRFSCELHAVVGQRAIIHRQREEIALARVQGRSTGRPSPEEEISAKGSTQEVGQGQGYSFGAISDSGSGSTQREAQDLLPGRRQTTLDKETAGFGSNREINSPTFVSTPLVNRGSVESAEEEVVTGGERLEESLVSSSAVGVLNVQPSLGSPPIVQTAANEMTSSEGENALFVHTTSSQTAAVSGSRQLVSVSPVSPTFENAEDSLGGEGENEAESHPASSSMPVQASHKSNDLLSHSEAGGNIGQESAGKKIPGPQTSSENVAPPCLVETDENTGSAPGEENVCESRMSDPDDIPPRPTDKKIPGSEALSGNVIPPCLVETDENTGTAPGEENVLESQMFGSDVPCLTDIQSGLGLSVAQTTVVGAGTGNRDMTELSATSNHTEPVATAITADSLPSVTQAFESQDVTAPERETTTESNTCNNVVGDQSKTLPLHGETDAESHACCRPGVEETAEPETSNHSVGQVSSHPSVSQAAESHIVYSGVEATPRSHTSNSVALFHPRNLSDTFSRDTSADGIVEGGGIGERNMLESQPLNSDVPTSAIGQSNSLSQQHEGNAENVNRFEKGGNPPTVSQIPRADFTPPLTNTQVSNSASSVTTQTVQNQGGVMTGREVSPQPGNRVAAESYSLLAVKLTSAENLSTTTTEEMRELLPGAHKKAEALNAQKMCSCHLQHDGSPPGDDLGSRRHVPAPQQPYMEGWRSSVQRSKDMHWKTCERLLHENLGVDPARIRELIENESLSEMKSKINLQEQMSSPHQDHQQNAAQNHSSFLELSMSDDLLFTPDDIPMSTGGQLPPYDENQVSSAMPQNQVHYPQTISPSREGFVNIDGTLVSRHNFTPNCRDRVLNKALSRLNNSDHFHREDDDRQDMFKKDDDEDEQQQQPLFTPNRNRRRHKAERVKSSTKEWVNITHLEVKSHTGSQFSIIREKDMSNQDAKYCKNIPTPDPTSSFNTSLALMAAARAHSFPCLHEEHFVGDGDAATEEMDGLLPPEVGGAVGGCPLSPLVVTGTGREGPTTTTSMGVVEVGFPSRPWPHPTT